MYGVNTRSLLDSLTFFDVCSGTFVPDIMHDILEGVLPLEVRLMLAVGIFGNVCAIHLHLCIRLLTYFGTCTLLNFFV